MRLIDADAFKAYMRNALEQTRNAYPDKGEWAETITEQFCKDIDDQPTVYPDPDTVSRQKGHWTNISVSFSGDSTADCSRCGATIHNSFAGTINFCPNCGADMRP